METENSMDPAPDIPKRAALAAQHVNGQLPPAATLSVICAQPGSCYL